MGWRPQVDIRKPAAKETMRADIQTSCRLTESDLSAQQVGDLAARLHQVLLLLCERYGRGHATDIAAGDLTVAQLSILTTLIDCDDAQSLCRALPDRP
jgi:hypothetical protein